MLNAALAKVTTDELLDDLRASGTLASLLMNKLIIQLRKLLLSM